MAHRISARELGSGDPAVLLAGFGLSGRYLVPLAERLACDFRVLVPELPASGRTPAARALTIAELAEAVDGLMEGLDLEDALVYGNSRGAQIGVELALRSPRRVRLLALGAPVVECGARTFRQQLPRLARAAREAPFSLVALALRDYARTGFRRLLAEARIALAYPLEERLPLVETPTLVIRGARDPVATEAWAETVAALLPRGRLETIPDAGHGLPYEVPDELAALLRAAVRDARPAASRA